MTTNPTRLAKPPERQEDKWKNDGLCVGRADCEAWFPVGETLTMTNVGAIEICHECPVRTDCLNHALATNERFGIWGGTTEQQRDRMRRRGR
jgi:WhiB family redox-sensing transcriptional regulator